MTAAAEVANELLRGRELYANRAWRDAYVALSAADQAESLAADDLELLLLQARRPTIALREFYKDRMSRYLGYEAFGSYDRPVRNSRQAELYKLIYASKIKLGSHLWDKVNKDEPDSQTSLIV